MFVFTQVYRVPSRSPVGQAAAHFRRCRRSGKVRMEYVVLVEAEGSAFDRSLKDHINTLQESYILGPRPDGPNNVGGFQN